MVKIGFFRTWKSKTCDHPGDASSRDTAECRSRRPAPVFSAAVPSPRPGAQAASKATARRLGEGALGSQCPWGGGGRTRWRPPEAPLWGQCSPQPAGQCPGQRLLSPQRSGAVGMMRTNCTMTGNVAGRGRWREGHPDGALRVPCPVPGTWEVTCRWGPCECPGRGLRVPRKWRLGGAVTRLPAR